MDAAVAVALIFAGLALGIAIGAIMLALRAGGTAAATAVGMGAASGGSETLHRSYSEKLDAWINHELLPYINDIYAVVDKNHPGQLGDPGIKNPPPPPGGGD
jgi:hypothetical protein